MGCPGGVEVVAHSLRDCLNEHKGSKLALFKIDFRNAFNEVKRSHFVKAASEMFPAMCVKLDGVVLRRGFNVAL